MRTAVLLQGNQGAGKCLSQVFHPTRRVGGLPGGSPLQGSAVSSGVWAVASLGCDGRRFVSPGRSGHDWLEKAAQDGDGKLQLSKDLQLKINNIFSTCFQ